MDQTKQLKDTVFRLARANLKLGKENEKLKKQNKWLLIDIRNKKNIFK